MTRLSADCEGLAAMRIDKGHFGDVDLSGLCFAGVVRWPGPIHEGQREIVPLIDEQADERQREALLRILSGQEGDTMFEIFAFVCPTVHEPQFVPFEFEFDLENPVSRPATSSRRSRTRCGGSILPTRTA